MQVAKIEHVMIGDTLVAKVKGTRFDASFAINFKQDVSAFLKESNKIIIDLSEVNYMDSTGFGSLVYAHKKIGSAGDGAFFKIASAKGEIVKLIKLAKMDRVLNTPQTMYDAFDGDEDKLADYESNGF